MVVPALVAACALAGLGFLGRIVRSRSREERARLCLVANRVIQAARGLRDLDRGEYLPARHVLEWSAGWEDLEYVEPSKLSKLPAELRKPYVLAEKMTSNCEEYRSRRNEKFVATRLAESAPWFEQLGERPLTAAQRRSVVVNEDHTVVVAAAGTGKTTTLEAKVAYLVERGLALPEEILVVAFNRSVAREVQERLDRWAALAGVVASTFHALGSSILGVATGRKAALSELAESKMSRVRLFESVLVNVLSQDRYRRNFERWFVDLLIDKVTFDECRTPEEREARERGQGIVTLGGKKLKSHSEVRVANWLSLNGVRWAYEARYEGAPSSSDKRDYTPDFHLPDHDVWIEVWAVDRHNKTAPYIDAEAYVESMDWKRALHARNGTMLVEIFQDDIWSGHLGGVLAQRLGALGVVLEPVTQDEMQALLRSASLTVREFCDLVDTFLQLFRSGSYGLDELRRRAETEREAVFIELFEPFLDAYIDALREEERIDFHTMLLEAANHVRDGHYEPSWKYILVDETQDFSRARVELVEALRDHGPDTAITLVGDDWQSIYRFAGSDISYFTGAERRLGVVERVDLDQTFRLTANVHEVSSRFVMQNDSQLKKKVKPHRPDEQPGIAIHLYEDGAASSKSEDWRERRAHASALALSQVLEQIEHQGEPGDLVMILARYTHVLRGVKEVAERFQSSSGYEVSCRTVHAAKGLEADHVVVLDVSDGLYGFPTGRSDDRILRLVQAEPEEHPFAEERRLFYVAMTRTKGRVYLSAPIRRLSPFLHELIEGEELGGIELTGAISALYRCPVCKGKTIFKQQGRYGAWWSCLRWPRCEGRLPACSECEEGALLPACEGEDVRSWSCVECDSAHRVCPRCGKGALMLKSGQYGPFFGCSEWKKDNAGCGYTAKANLAD